MTSHKLYRSLLVTGTLIVLVAVNMTIYDREKTLQEGEKIYLRLSPADPRSMTKGDYQSLSYSIFEDIQKNLSECKDRLPLKRCNASGYAIVEIGDDSIAKFISLYHGEELSPRERKLKFHIENSRLTMPSSRFFFREGNGRLYTNAVYAGLRLNPDGTTILENLYDESLEKIDESDR